MTASSNANELELLNVKAVAKILSVSARQVWRLRDGGLLPAPLRIAGSVRWIRAEIQEWIRCGAKPVRPAPSAKRRA